METGCRAGAHVPASPPALTRKSKSAAPTVPAAPGRSTITPLMPRL
jgi:hypothetical protein